MLRTEEARNRRSQARTVSKHLKGTQDKGRIAAEPGEGKRSSPVLEQRWAGRLTHRLSHIERAPLYLRSQCGGLHVRGEQLRKARGIAARHAAFGRDAVDPGMAPGGGEARRVAGHVLAVHE